MINKAEENFNTLPAELKAKFDNNVEKYVGEYGSESWAEKLGWKKEEKVDNEPKL